MSAREKRLKPFGTVVVDESIASTTSAKAPLIHRAVDALIDHGGILPTQRLLVEICLYEALSNAILHGNREDAAKQVRLKMFADDSRWGAIIEDEGDGFDVAAVPDPTSGENVLRDRGRGIALMKLYVDALTYNAKGNVVMMVKSRRAASVAETRR